MGIEDFGVLLRPAQPISADLVEHDLLNQGFVASSGTAFPHTAYYVLCDEAKNIESMLKRDPDHDPLLSYLSVRYAICQPETATEAFLDIVTQIAGKFCLQMTGLAPGVEFSCNTLGEFQEYTREKVSQAKSRWSSLFAGDNEEVVLSVAESWKYFIKKHPQALRSERHLAG